MTVQAQCPGCRAVLRIPDDWLDKPIRCKHCNLVIQLRQKNASMPAGSSVKPAHAAERTAASAQTQTPARNAPQGTSRAGAQPRPARKGSRQLIAFVGIWFLGIAGLAGAIVVATRTAEKHVKKDVEAAAVGKEKASALKDGSSGPKANVSPKAPPDPEKKPLEPPKTGEAPKKNDPPGKPANPPKKGEDASKLPGGPAKRPADPPKPPPPDPTPVKPPQGDDLPVAPKSFPRRLLTIGVANPLYFNPINQGPANKDVHEIVKADGRLARALRVDPSQVVELADGATGDSVRPPIKGKIEEVLAKFLDQSRAQDRVVVLFVGHAVEIEDTPNLVPLDGENGVKETMIALGWVYQQLGKCKARQKVLIVDVCRFDPTAPSTGRPGSGPMGEKMAEALKNPPAGVQVWSACSAGQFSREGLNGGIFLHEIFQFLEGLEKKRVTLGIQKPDNTLPLEDIIKHVGAKTEDATKAFKPAQTPFAAGAEIAEGAAPYNPAEPLPPPFAVELKETDKETIRSIVDEAAKIPPVKVLPPNAPKLRPDALWFLKAEALENYKPDYAKTPFREAIQSATAVLEKHKKSYQEEFRNTNLDQLKQSIQPIQKDLSSAKLDLEEALEALVEAGKERDKEPSRSWQAHYDYVLARLKARVAFVFEYQYMLSEIRTDALPERPMSSPGWRLAPREKMQCKGTEGKEAKKHAEEAKKILDKLAEDHKGTPWEVLAKRDKSITLGLEWQAIR